MFRFIKFKRQIKNDEFTDRDLVYFEEQLENELEKKNLLTLKITIYLNLSLCYLVLSNFTNGFQAAQEALILDPLNPKALFRRAKSKLMDSKSSKKLHFFV